MKMRGSSKIAWIAAIRNTHYPLILTLCCDVFMFLVKQGVPSDEELDWLSHKLENWKVVGRRLKIDTQTLTAFDMENRGWFEKSYRMLLHWKERNGSTATYTILHDALCHPLVKRTDLAEQLMTGNIPLILKFNKYTITYKNSALILRHYAFWLLYLLRSWLTVPRNRKVSLHLWVAKSKRRKTIWCVCIFSCSFLVD